MMMHGLGMLVPTETATHVAVSDGDWADPSTWSTGSVPGAGAIVHIPAGIQVSLDGADTGGLFCIRVDGTLDVAASQGSQTTISVDTIVVTAQGTFNVDADHKNDGDVDIIFSPFDIEAWKANGGGDWNAQAKAHFVDGETVASHYGDALQDGAGVLGRFTKDAETGALSGWDPGQLSLGLVAMGEVNVAGQAKTTHDVAAGDIFAGDTSVTLASVPAGWSVGDEIFITGTRYSADSVPNSAFGTYDEVRTISSIDGSTIHFEEPLEFDHEGFAEHGYFAHIANLDRNVTFSSPETANVTERGHVMLMHNDAFDIANAAFEGLGRTDKSNIVDDYGFTLGESNQRGIFIDTVSGALAPLDEVENMRGRYPLHFHFTEESEDGKKPQADGVVVAGSPGWGLVHHGGALDILNSLVVDVDGAGMVAENGSETGVWAGNLVAAIRSVFREGTDHGLDGFGGAISNKLHHQIRSKLDDDFRQGDGYGLQSRVIIMEDNVAASVATAFRYEGNMTFTPLIGQTSTDAIPIDGFPLDETIEAKRAPIVLFEGNVAFGVKHVFTSRTRSETGDHHLQSVISDLIAWNVDDRAIYMAANNGYIMEGLHIIADPVSTGEKIGFLFHVNTDDLHIVNSIIEGMDQGIIGGGQNKSGDHRIHPEAQHLVVDVDWGSLEDPFADFYPGVILLSSEDLPDIPVTFEQGPAMDLLLDFDIGDFNVTVDGTLTDRAGTYEFGHYHFDGSGPEERHYDFTDKVEAYLHEYGLLREGDMTWTTLTEFAQDRVTAEIYAFDFLISILGLDSNFVSNADDFFIATEASEVMAGGGGVDTLSYVGADEGLRLKLKLEDQGPKGAAAGDIISGFENATGTAFRDIINGTSSANTLLGERGGDTLRGLAGKDLLIGGIGADKIFGGKGNDVLIGGVGEDTLWGGQGKDVFVFLDQTEFGDTIVDFDVTEGDRIDAVGLGPGTFTVNEDALGSDLLFDGQFVVRLENVSGIGDPDDLF